MRPYRRRKAYTIVVFLAIAGLIFICFQVLSIQMLNRQTHDNSIKTREEAEDDCPEGDCNNRNRQEKPAQKVRTHKPLTKEQRKSQKQAIARVIDDLKFQHTGDKGNLSEGKVIHHDLRAARPVEKPVQRIHQRDELDRPRGVPRHWAHLYHADSHGMFSCVDTRLKIPFTRVNDDYCDCDDGSDEPGTSACNNGRFYCEFQLSEDHLVWLPSSNVNDGLCDCCDGSDEWNSPPLAKRVSARGRKPGGDDDPQPCINRCDDAMREFEKEDAIARDGRKIKQMYIAEAKGKPNHNHMYGLYGEFLPLSESCYDARSDKYRYSVCPFKQITQSDGGSVKAIGRSPAQWVSLDPKLYKLKMGNGDPLQCPGRKDRISWLIFSCGLNNIVTSIQETEICEYTIKILTPAAC